MRSMLAITLAASASAIELKPVMKLRGGLAGVDPATAASAALSLSAVNSAYVALAPEPACRRTVCPHQR